MTLPTTTEMHLWNEGYPLFLKPVHCVRLYFLPCEVCYKTAQTTRSFYFLSIFNIWHRTENIPCCRQTLNLTINPRQKIEVAVFFWFFGGNMSRCNELPTIKTLLNTAHQTQALNFVVYFRLLYWYLSGPQGSWIVCCLHLKIEFRSYTVAFLGID